MFDTSPLDFSNFSQSQIILEINDLIIIIIIVTLYSMFLIFSPIIFKKLSLLGKWQIDLVKLCYKNLINYIKTFDPREGFYCEQCPCIKKYNWMDKNMYYPLIAEKKLSKKDIKVHKEYKPIPCTRSKLIPCSECSRMLCPNCTIKGLKWGRHYHPFNKNPFFIKCNKCCWNEIS